jgi:hypothetical protein
MTEESVSNNVLETASLSLVDIVIGTLQRYFESSGKTKI